MKIMKNVAIYTTLTCHFCKDAKAFFKTHNVPYQEYDVLADTARREEMIDRSGQMGVPVIEITSEDGTEQHIVGFDKKGLSAALGV